MNLAQVEYIQRDLDSIFSDVSLFGELRSKKVFLTGASGFIGQWLLLSFAHLNNKHDFNISITASSRNITESSIISHLKVNNKFEFQDIDVRYPFDVPVETDFIIHLAGSPDRRVHASSPLDVIRTITDGTENVLKAATRVDKLSKALIFTSGLTHGKQDNSTENTSYKPFDCLNFSSSYTESKRLAETICHVYARQHHIPLGIVRPYSFIGPLQDLDRPWAINNFINGALRNKEIRVLGNPETRKSFLYPTDMVVAILKYLLSDKAEAPLELGTREIVSLDDICRKIVASVDFGVRIDYSDRECKTARHDFYPANSELNESMSFDECLSKSIAWYKLAVNN